MTILLTCSVVNADTHYIRTDGGNGTECTGLADAAYDGAGSGEACAMNHPNWVFPPTGESTTRAAADGDTVIIKLGSYRIGCQNAANCRDSEVNLTIPSNCSSSSSFACDMGIIPDNVTFIGCSSAGCNTLDGCETAGECPELWGAGRVTRVVNIQGSTSVTLSDLDITDHASCGQGNQNGYVCSASSSNLSAKRGVYWHQATSPILRNLNIHGIWATCIFGGKVVSHTLDNVTCAYNSYAGIDTNSCGGDACPMSGTNVWTDTKIIWSGCVEDGDNPGTIVSEGCYGNKAGGYGDAFGTDASNTSTGDYTFTNVDVSHNVQDGLDFVHFLGGHSVTITRSRFEGNAGNGVKNLPQDSLVTNSFFIGNCGFFSGQSFTQSGSMDHCRGSGNPIGYSWKGAGSETPRLYASTITSNGDIGILIGGTCSKSDVLEMKNNIFLGGDDFSAANGSLSAFIYFNSSSCRPTLTDDYNVCDGWKAGGKDCKGSNSLADTDPLFAGTILQGPTFYTGTDYIDQLTLQSGSPARGLSDVTLTDLDDLDYNQFDRGALAHDAGGFEFGTVAGSGCGNNTTEVGEVCDGTDVNSETCVSQGFTSGTLACESDCSAYDTSSCVTSLCDDGNIDPGEDCDTNGGGADLLNGGTCISEGFAGGTLACLSTCLYDTTSCTAIVCQDSIVSTGEECDDGNSTEGDGCSSICENENPSFELFLNYSENDTIDHLTRKTHDILMVGIDHANDSVVYKDFSAGNFGDFTQRLKITISSCSDNGAGTDGGAGIWAMSEALYGDLNELETAMDGIVLSLSCKSSVAEHTWKLVADGVLIDSQIDVPPTLIRYVDIDRSTTTGTMTFYSDANFTSSLFTLTGTVPATTYRYLYTGLSFNDSVSGVSFEGVISDLDITAGASPPAGPGTNAVILTGSGEVGDSFP